MVDLSRVMERDVDAFAVALDFLTMSLSSISKEDVICVLNRGETFWTLNCLVEPNSKAREIAT